MYAHIILLFSDVLASIKLACFNQCLFLALWGRGLDKGSNEYSQAAKNKTEFKMATTSNIAVNYNHRKLSYLGFHIVHCDLFGEYIQDCGVIELT